MKKRKTNSNRMYRRLTLAALILALGSTPLFTLSCQESTAAPMTVEPPVGQGTVHHWLIDVTDSIRRKTLALMKRILEGYTENYVAVGDTVVVVPCSNGMGTPIPIRITSERDLAEVVGVIDSLKIAKPAKGTKIFTNFKKTIEDFHEYLKLHPADGRAVRVLVLSDGKSHPPPGETDVDFTAFSPTILQARRGLKVAFLGEGDLELDRLLRKPRKLLRDPASIQLVPDLSRFVQPDVYIADRDNEARSQPSLWKLGDSEQVAHLDITLNLKPAVERTVAISSVEVLTEGNAQPVHGYAQAVRFDEQGMGTLGLTIPLVREGTYPVEVVIAFSHGVRPLVVSTPATLYAASWWDAHQRKVWGAGLILLVTILIPLASIRTVRSLGKWLTDGRGGRPVCLPVGGSCGVPLHSELDAPPGHVRRVKAKSFTFTPRGRDGDRVEIAGELVTGEVPYRLGDPITFHCADFEGTVTLRETKKPRGKRAGRRNANRGFETLFGDDPLGGGGAP